MIFIDWFIYWLRIIVSVGLFLSLFFLSFLNKEGVRLKVHEKKFLNFQKQIVELEEQLFIVKMTA